MKHKDTTLFMLQAIIPTGKGLSGYDGK